LDFALSLWITGIIDWHHVWFQNFLVNRHKIGKVCIFVLLFDVEWLCIVQTVYDFEGFFRYFLGILQFYYNLHTIYIVYCLQINHVCIIFTHCTVSIQLTTKYFISITPLLSTMTTKSSIKCTTCNITLRELEVKKLGIKWLFTMQFVLWCASHMYCKKKRKQLWKEIFQL